MTIVYHRYDEYDDDDEIEAWNPKKGLWWLYLIVFVGVIALVYFVSCRPISISEFENFPPSSKSITAILLSDRAKQYGFPSVYVNEKSRKKFLTCMDNVRLRLDASMHDE